MYSSSVISICPERTVTKRAVRFVSGKLPTGIPQCQSSPYRPTSCQTFRRNAPLQDSATMSRNLLILSISAEPCPRFSDHDGTRVILPRTHAMQNCSICRLFCLFTALYDGSRLLCQYLMILWQLLFLTETCNEHLCRVSSIESGSSSSVIESKTTRRSVYDLAALMLFVPVYMILYIKNKFTALVGKLFSACYGTFFKALVTLHGFL